jgi:DNA (cytosine-5)-methyltransferase 1
VMTGAIYNEIEPFAVRWMENLIHAGHIANGSIELRSIAEIAVDDVRRATQFHAFAGLGGWSHALRSAGWPDDLAVWTGSCPCQPFSQAGRGRGTADDRHLWPEWFRLIEQCRPAVVFGEQVASPAGLVWLDAICTDLEGAGYAVRAFDLCAAGVGAPHLRQRLYFVAVARDERREGIRLRLLEWQSRSSGVEAGRHSEASELGDACEPGGGRDDRAIPGAQGEGAREWVEPGHLVDELKFTSASSVLADAGGQGRVEVGENARRSEGRSGAEGLERRPLHGGAEYLANAGRDECGSGRGRQTMEGRSEPGRSQIKPDRHGAGGTGTLENAYESHPLHGNQPGSWRLVQPAPHATTGFWSPADWIPCLDGKARPVEPGTFPLAHGATARVGRLRAYGNAIVAPLAAEFVAATIDALIDGGRA